MFIRRSHLSAAAVALTLGLAACGGSDGDADVTPGSSAGSDPGTVPAPAPGSDAGTGSGNGPATDAFVIRLAEIFGMTAENTEPVAIDTITVTAPENTEPGQID